MKRQSHLSRSISLLLACSMLPVLAAGEPEKQEPTAPKPVVVPPSHGPYEVTAKTQESRPFQVPEEHSYLLTNPHDQDWQDWAPSLRSLEPPKRRSTGKRAQRRPARGW